MKKRTGNLYYADMTDMVGLTFTNITASDDKISFDCKYGQFVMEHEQDCCENVYVESIVGDISDLVNQTLMTAEQSTVDVSGEYSESATATFYKFSTIKGYVDIRWVGESNGYYSEEVSLYFIALPDADMSVFEKSN